MTPEQADLAQQGSKLMSAGDGVEERHYAVVGAALVCSTTMQQAAASQEIA
jgi:hypothetical protein